MTEEEWLAAADPVPMLEFVRERANDRKLRLFAVACWYRVWAAQMPADTNAAVVLFVGYLDGVVSPHTWFEGFRAAGGAHLGLQFSALVRTDALVAATESAKRAAKDVGQRAWDAVPFDAHATDEQRWDRLCYCKQVEDRTLAGEEAAQVGFVRDIFGNPFRPVEFSPEWRTDTAVALARQMYDSRDFGAMPILADALQDAGCDSEGILAHCRGLGPHVRGCWVVDLVLGKE